MPLGYVAVDRDWRITYVNSEGEAVLGRTWDQLVGACYWRSFPFAVDTEFGRTYREVVATGRARTVEAFYPEDRKSTRLKSSHANISYAVFCLKKKKL